LEVHKLDIQEFINNFNEIIENSDVDKIVLDAKISITREGISVTELKAFKADNPEAVEDES